MRNVAPAAGGGHRLSRHAKGRAHSRPSLHRPTPPAAPRQVENAENTGVEVDEPILPQGGDYLQDGRVGVLGPACLFVVLFFSGIFTQGCWGGERGAPP